MSKIIVKAEKMVSGGNCLAKINGKNVFIPYAIPGETLEIEIIKSFRDYDIAKITKILESSPHRTNPFCKLYGKCGGCNLQHIEPNYQIELRKQILQECFAREKIEIPEIEVISGNEKSYRCRIQLTDGGFNEKESNEIVHLDFCPVATDEINEYLSKTSQQNRPQGRVHIFGDKRIISQNKVIVADETERNSKDIKLEGKISSKKKKNLHLKKNTYFSGTNLNDKNKCSLNLAGKEIEFDVQGFFQSNLDVLEKTVSEITKNMGGKNCLDMYSGCGTFSVFLSDIFEKLFLVEHNREQIVFAEKNLAEKKHESYGMSGEKFVRENASLIIANDGNFDAVVIDPPRSGMEKTVCQWLCQSKIPQIRAVSCNPSTQARDASYLLKAGYKITKLYLLDFYPQTAHIESLANFEYI